MPINVISPALLWSAMKAKREKARKVPVLRPDQIPTIKPFNPANELPSSDMKPAGQPKIVVITNNEKDKVTNLLETAEICVKKSVPQKYLETMRENEHLEVRVSLIDNCNAKPPLALVVDDNGAVRDLQQPPVIVFDENGVNFVQALSP